MDNAARITSSALCLFRESETAKSNEHMAKWEKLCKIDNDKRTQEQEYDLAIAFHKAMRAAEDARAAHVMLCGDKADFFFNRDINFFFQIGNEEFLAILGPKMTELAEAGYEYFENRMEDAALSKFHYDAFGE